MDFVRLARRGVTIRELRRICIKLAIGRRELVGLLSISERQLDRYDDTHILRKDISSHLVHLVLLYDRGYRTLGQDSFFRWVQSPAPALDHQRPFDLLDTAIGIQLVEEALGRMEHGIPA